LHSSSVQKEIFNIQLLTRLKSGKNGSPPCCAATKSALSALMAVVISCFQLWTFAN